MRIVEPNVEFIGEVPLLGQPGSLELIERAGRTCYKSETDEITEETAKKFIMRMWKSGHLSVLEHSNMVFNYNPRDMNDVVYPQDMFANNQFLKHIYDYDYDNGNDRIYLAGNLRAWIEFSGVHPMEDYDSSLEQVLESINIISHNNGFPKGKLTLAKKIPEEFQRATFRLTTDRAVLAEITRHRIDIAFSVESQRYVNYKEGVTFIKPSWYNGYVDEIMNQIYIFEESLARAEDDYKLLCNSGMKPQFARGVLPNATQTIIFLTADRSEFRHIFKMRCSPAAHPDIQNLANIMKFHLDQLDQNK